MTAIDWIFIVLYYINLAAIILVTVGFIPQALFYLFFWLPRKHWKPSTDYHKFAIIIAAHNEEAVIYKTVKYLLNDMDYPKELYHVYVCAHNCTDKTAEEARRAGATVFEFNDPNKKNGFLAWPLWYIYPRVLKMDPEAEIYTRFDADNLPCKTFLKEMNNSVCAGARIVRGYECASNLRQNVWTEECALFYLKDSRVQNTFRQFFHSTSMMPGPGITMTKEVVEKMNGWDCMTPCEDAQFTWRRLFDGYKIYFNTDAVIYEDQPSTYADTRNRLVRLGGSLNRLYFKEGWKMLVAFFRTGNPMYLDMLLQIQFNPVSVICFTWFPLYYATYAILMLIGMCGHPVFSAEFFTFNLYSMGNLTTLAPTANIIFSDAGGFFASYLNQKIYYTGAMGLDFQIWASGQAFIGLLHMAWQVILMLSVFCIFQSYVAVMMDHRKLGLTWKLEGMWKGILLSPLFSLIYGFCNCLGAISHPKWKIAKRNPEKTEILTPLPEKPKKIRHYFTISEREQRRYSGHWWEKKAK